MKTENKKTKCKIDNHGKNSTQKRAKKCDKLQRSRQQSSQGFSREDKHILKKRIVKILTKKGRVRFDKLLHKLDIQPSVLAKALAKLEGKGIITKVQNEFKSGKKDHGNSHDAHQQGHLHPGCHKQKTRYQAEKSHDSRKHEGHSKGRDRFHGKQGKRSIGSCHFALSSAL